jgi:hypothetical protein
VAYAKLAPRLLWMRIMMQDGMDCIFAAHVAADRMHGSYDCLQGGGELEESSWNTERAY